MFQNFTNLLFLIDTHRQRFLAILFFFYALSINAQPMLWNVNNINKTKCDKTLKIYQYIIQRATLYVNAPEIHITNKNRQFVSDPHYYVSLGTYWWPDSNSSDIRYVRRDGYINPETKKYDREKLKELAERLKYLSLAFYFESKDEYYEAFERLLRGWFCDNDTYMYPNFEYAQVIPGQNNNRGRAAGLIETRTFNDVLESIRLVELSKPIDWKTISSVKWWFYEFSQWMLNSNIGIEEDKACNNQGIAYDVIMLNIALFTGQMDLFNKITRNFNKRRLIVQIAEDGSMPMELERTNSLSYSVLNLQFIIDFCKLQNSAGNSYYKSNKLIIDKVAQYLWNNAGDNKVWPHKQISDVKLEKRKLRNEFYRLLQIDNSKESIYSTIGISSKFLTVDEMLK